MSPSDSASSEHDASRASHAPSIPPQGKAPPVGTVLAGRYTLMRFLGAGGMGAVYEAADPQGQRVAVKVLLRTLSAHEGALKRFQREAAVTANLGSEHIVSTLDSGVDEERNLAFMVMPLMLGLDLEQLVERLGPLHPTLAVRMVRQACKALSTAHAQGIVHRDVKPANLFLDHDAQGAITVRVLDFGIAKWRDGGAELTTTGSMLGTPVFMAPEQFVDVKRVDARSDVWSLGMTLYQALTGYAAFHSCKTFAELYIAIATGEVPLVQERAPWLDPALGVVLHGSLLRDLDARCPTTAAFAEVLEPFAYGSDEVHATMLLPLGEDIRNYQASPMSRPETWRAAKPEAAVPKVTCGERDPLIGQTIAGRYRLLRKLGEGGMGAVYEAVTADETRLAVKVIRRELGGGDASARRRFLREAKVMQRITDDHVVRVHAVGTDPERDLPYIAMELLQGTDLREVMRRHGALPPPLVARLFVQACRGLAAAHAHDFVHRDVKPANLFLHRQPSGELSVKVCDFGVVKQLTDDGEGTGHLTRTGGVIGSPMYMSPEQATNSKSIDARSDIWSLGATLYEALAGAPPWKGKETVGEIIVAVCTQPLPHVQDHAPWVPTDLAEAVHRAMRRDAGDRFESVAELAEALAPFTRGSLAVRDEQLVTVSQAAAAEVAPRASAPDGALSGSGANAFSTSAVGAISGTGAGAMAHSLAEPAKKSRGAALAISALVAVAGIGAGAWMLRAPSSQGSELTAAVTSNEPAPSSEPSGEEAHVFELTIPVDPPTAKAQVDGEPHPLRDGVLHLQGEPGDSFQVVLDDEDRHLEELIFVGRDGTPSRKRLELPPAPEPPAAPAAAPAPFPRPSKPIPRPPPKPAPKPKAAPPPPPPPPKPSIQAADEW